jgi:hypothetical protein
LRVVSGPIYIQLSKNSRGDWAKYSQSRAYFGARKGFEVANGSAGANEMGPEAGDGGA